MQPSRKAQLVQGSVGPTLVKLTIPMIFGILGMVAFNLVDTFFVGRLGATELAAISFTFPVILVINSLAMGLGVGASAVISRAIGEGDHFKVQRLTTDSLVLAVLIVAVFVVIGLFTIEPIFQLMGATPELMPLIKQYMSIWYLGVVFVVVPMVGNNAIRATGDTKTPSAIMLVAVFANIVLDPLLIFGVGPFPRLELAGAATATVIGRAITLVVALWVLYYREKMIIFIRPAFNGVLASWKKVLYIGLPTAGTNMILPVGAGVITRLVSAYGPEAVAGYGVSTRIDMFALTVLMALGSVLGPFVGQNRGANKLGRVFLAIKYAQQFSMGWGAGMFVLLTILASSIAMLFNDNPMVISTVALYLSIVPLGYGFQGVLMLSNTALNVLNKPFYAALLIILQMFGLYIPLAMAGSTLFGLPGLFGAALAANLIAGTSAYFTLRWVLSTQAKVPVETARAAVSAPEPVRIK